VETFNKMDFIMQTDIGKKELREIIAKLVAEGNRSKQSKENEFAGCTANVCFLTEEEVIVANAGDSRCVACVNGKPVPLSFDHHPQDKNEMKRIKKAGGFVSGGRVNQSLNLSRSIGDIEFKNNRQLNAAEQMISSTPDIHKIDRKGVEFIIMGCDGIWETKNN
jgi:serine/threonine protein phosphatase PrpC